MYLQTGKHRKGSRGRINCIAPKLGGVPPGEKKAQEEHNGIQKVKKRKFEGKSGKCERKGLSRKRGTYHGASF